MERAHRILELIRHEPGKLRLIDLSKRLDLNKSSMFVLLHTLEELGWVTKDANDTYSLGRMLGVWGHAFASQFDLNERFREEAGRSRDKLGETIQLARLEGNQALYLGKVEAPSRVKLVSEPGMRFPAHATALGKALLAWRRRDELERILDERLEELTPNTVTSRAALLAQLEQIRSAGFATEEQESAMGFCCVAAPVLDSAGAAAAAVSASIPVHKWEESRERAKEEIVSLAGRLSLFLTSFEEKE
ncbi:IclR family transcriptional regulator [Cohnella cellulosilytica]|uniref:IclR family transcriptional regulator n=1 Tax=Cohnella cellulosilytica TaxID=986710 RepID=UPI0035EC6012